MKKTWTEEAWEDYLISHEDPFYSAENQARLARRIADMKNGVNCSEHELIEA